MHVYDLSVCLNDACVLCKGLSDEDFSHALVPSRSRASFV
jgi:hypothetical protein